MHYRNERSGTFHATATSAFLIDIRSHGATVEQMTIEVNKAKANLESAEKELKNMSVLNKVRILHHQDNPYV